MQLGSTKWGRSGGAKALSLLKVGGLSHSKFSYLFTVVIVLLHADDFSQNFVLLQLVNFEVCSTWLFKVKNCLMVPAHKHIIDEFSLTDNCCSICRKHFGN